MEIQVEAKELADLIRAEAVKLLYDRAKQQAQTIFNIYDEWKPTYPYGQFNPLPKNLYSAWERDLETLRGIYDVKLEEYIKTHGRVGFVKVISGARKTA